MTSPTDPHSTTYCHINGTHQDMWDRIAVSEICKGWPVYRDASEWKNYRSLFAEDALVWTTWSGPMTVDKFIEASKNGKTKGDFIMHRECGTLVELGATVHIGNGEERRAVGKMKATITQRFTDRDTGAEYDVDCDCRFIFFCVRSGNTSTTGTSNSMTWKAQYVKLFYEKDKVVPVNGVDAPHFDMQELQKFPVGYRYLGAAQARLGYPIDLQLATAQGELFKKMYQAMEKWLEGQEIDLHFRS